MSSPRMIGGVHDNRFPSVGMSSRTTPPRWSALRYPTPRANMHRPGPFDSGLLSGRRRRAASASDSVPELRDAFALQLFILWYEWGRSRE